MPLPSSSCLSWTCVDFNECLLISPSVPGGWKSPPSSTQTCTCSPVSTTLDIYFVGFSLSCQGLDCAPLPGKMNADSIWENPLGYSHLCTHFLRTDGILWQLTDLPRPSESRKKIQVKAESFLGRGELHRFQFSFNLTADWLELTLSHPSTPCLILYICSGEKTF